MKLSIIATPANKPTAISVLWPLPSRPHCQDHPSTLRRARGRATLRQARNRGREGRFQRAKAGLAAVGFVLFLCGTAAEASFITGNIRNTSGNPYATNALFSPLSTPQADGANIIASTPTNVIAAADRFILHHAQAGQLQGQHRQCPERHLHHLGAK